jgi:hypothetical protein
MESLSVPEPVPPLLAILSGGTLGQPGVRATLRIAQAVVAVQVPLGVLGDLRTIDVGGAFDVVLGVGDVDPVGSEGGTLGRDQNTLHPQESRANPDPLGLARIDVLVDLLDRADLLIIGGVHGGPSYVCPLLQRCISHDYLLLLGIRSG